MDLIKYYYFRDKQNKPRITVCLLKTEDRIARGIAICSILDNPCKQTGRNIAKGRAYKAMFAKENSCTINREPVPMLFDASGAIGLSLYKSAYNPSLTNFERKLLASPPKKYIQQKISFEIDCKIRTQA